ncbi:MAG TPA: DUF6799 domain-containing protein [Chitinophagaceae bacterium]|nr:DUF6799 domain-containing protein [Chitinophagaceae bacterium]
MKKLFYMFLSFFLVTSILTTVKAQDKIQQQDRIHQEDHLRLQDGSCLSVKDGVPTKLQKQLKLNNGTVVNPDGSYQLQNQERYQLRDGECLDMNGNRYLNQKKFNKRAMMSNKKIERVHRQSLNTNKPGNTGNKGGQRKGNN